MMVSFLHVHKSFIFFLQNQTLLTGQMPEILNGEKCEMKLLKMQMKKCPEIPRMPHMLS